MYVWVGVDILIVARSASALTLARRFGFGVAGILLCGLFGDAVRSVLSWRVWSRWRAGLAGCAGGFGEGADLENTLGDCTGSGTFEAGG